MLNLDRLHAFVVFSEHLSFTRAARELHVSQPALHVQIGKLSSELGVPLYKKVGQRLELTADGLRVAGFGREIRERTERLIDELRLRESRRQVVLCAGAGAYLYLLGPAITRFLGRKSAPLRLVTRDREATVQAVLSGEAHLGVASLETAPDGLTVEKLTEVGQILVVPPGHRLAQKRCVRLVDLDGERIIVPEAGRPHRAMIAQVLRSAGVAWEPAVEANGWDLMMRFVELGAGVAIVNGCCRVPEGLRARPLPELPARSYDLLWRPGVATEGAPLLLRRALLEMRDEWKKSAPARPHRAAKKPVREGKKEETGRPGRLLPSV
ncbi:MAG TPA: LysR family transcriptional regulator [Polyangiaceae bacterium]|nr:LysR family transcriptional regulator [Polyangiaceae bacterium]